jgi:hypothetical protein
MTTSLNLYYQYRERIRTGDLLEFRSQSVLGYLIRAKTGQMVNHTSMAMEYLLKDDTDRRVCLVEALAEGVRIHFLSDDLRNFNGEVYWTPYQGEEQLRSQIGRQMLKLIGKPYGFLDLLKNLAGPVRINEKELFCSEAVQVALIHAGAIPPTLNDGFALVPGQFSMCSCYHGPKMLIY